VQEVTFLEIQEKGRQIASDLSLLDRVGAGDLGSGGVRPAFHRQSEHLAGDGIQAVEVPAVQVEDTDDVVLPNEAHTRCELAGRKRSGRIHGHLASMDEKKTEAGDKKPADRFRKDSAEGDASQGRPVLVRVGPAVGSQKMGRM
jgi:hypothetical protein